MADTQMSPAMLLDKLAAQDPLQRRQVAAALRTVAETFVVVHDSRTTAHTLLMLTHMLDSD